MVRSSRTDDNEGHANITNNSTLNPKLRTFKLFKNEYKFENYLSSARNLKHVQALFRFRISSHNLMMETGRYTRPQTPENDRLCLHCQAQTVESESHFLLNCDLYRLEHAELMRKLPENILDISVMINL